jgi:hypothetical protein
MTYENSGRGATMLSLQGVNAALAGHEKLCGDRWDTLRVEMAEMREAIQQLWWVILMSAGTIIMGMASLIVVLIFHVHL